MAPRTPAEPARGSPYIQEVDKFSRWLDEQERTGITFEATAARKRSFISDADITGYFNRYLDPQSDADSWRVESLVRAATQDNPVNLKVQTDSVARVCPKVFAILTRIGRPSFIHAFVSEDELHDHALPFGPDKERLFPRLVGGQNFFKDFEARQWEFCVEPLMFDLMTISFNRSRILPIKEIVELERGGEGVSAVVHKIIVHEEYDKLKRPRDLRRSDGPLVRTLEACHQTRTDSVCL